MATGKVVSTDSRPYESLVEELKTLAELATESGSNDFRFSIAAKVVDEILSAESIDDIFAANASGPADIEMYLGAPVTVQSVRYFKSQTKYEANGLGAYVVMSALDVDGNDVLLSTGAPNVVATMRALEKRGAFPLRVKIMGKETPNGTLYTVAKG